MRHLSVITLIDHRIPDETTLPALRHLLEQIKLSGAIVECVKRTLGANGKAMEEATMVDGTIFT